MFDMPATFTHDFRFPLTISGDEKAGEIIKVVPLKDTRAPFNSGTWSAHISYHDGGSATYKITWTEVEPCVLENVELLEFDLGSPEYAAETGENMWGDGIQVTHDELLETLGSSEGGEYDIEPVVECEMLLRAVWRLKEAPEPVPESTSVATRPASGTGQQLAMQNSVMLASPSANNVRFIFPRDDGRELWMSDKVLVMGAPYFKTLFELSKSGIETPGASTSNKSRWHLAFNDSDNDDDAPTEPLFLSSESCKHSHYTIEIPNFSYATFHAVLSWILSHHIAFRPHATNSSTPEEPSSSTPPRSASPKSVYSLAQLLEIPELQALALEAIRSQVTVATVVADLFSETSRQFPAVLDIFIQFVADNREEIKEAGSWDEIAKRVKATPWAGEVVAKLLKNCFDGTLNPSLVNGQGFGTGKGNTKRICTGNLRE
ncbi:hypothetical protein RQP46_002287 [Phenoliferia psychrophenolica]